MKNNWVNDNLFYSIDYNIAKGKGKRNAKKRHFLSKLYCTSSLGRSILPSFQDWVVSYAPNLPIMANTLGVSAYWLEKSSPTLYSAINNYLETVSRGVLILLSLSRFLQAVPTFPSHQICQIPAWRLHVCFPSNHYCRGVWCMGDVEHKEAGQKGNSEWPWGSWGVLLAGASGECQTASLQIKVSDVRKSLDHTTLGSDVLHFRIGTLPPVPGILVLTTTPTALGKVFLSRLLMDAYMRTDKCKHFHLRSEAHNFYFIRKS